MTHVDERIQDLIDGDWWVVNDSPDYCVGRLIFAYMPYVDQIPYVLLPEGRTADPTNHSEAKFTITQLRINTRSLLSDSLPVAGLPLHNKEVYRVAKAKKRPAIIVAEGGFAIDQRSGAGMPKWQKGATLVAAPFYGVDHSGNRGGFPINFVNRVCQCEYPQFFLDNLPIDGVEKSILFLNHMQALGKRIETLEWTRYCLSNNALVILADYISWFMYGEIEKGCALAEFKEMMGNL